MPYKRAYTKRKRYGARRSGTSKGWSRYIPSAATAAKALSLAKYAASVLNVEQKFFNTSQNTTLATSTIISLFHPPQGDGASQRDGISVKMTHWSFNLMLRCPSTQTQYNAVRVVLFMDHQCNGANPLVTDVLDLDNDMVCHRNLANGRRFHIYMDKVYQMVPGTDRQVHTIEYGKSCGTHFLFDSSTGGTGAVADLTTNNLCLFLIPLFTTGVTTEPSYYLDCRSRYVDN